MAEMCLVNSITTLKFNNTVSLCGHVNQNCLPTSYNLFNWYFSASTLTGERVSLLSHTGTTVFQNLHVLLKSAGVNYIALPLP